MLKAARCVKYCALFLDEMEIAEAYEQDCSADVFGRTTLPLKPDKPAQHALVFVVGGLTQRWKQLIANHFTRSLVNERSLKEYVLQIVQLCDDISLTIRVANCDMGMSKCAMWQEFNPETIALSVPFHTLASKIRHFISVRALHMFVRTSGANF